MEAKLIRETALTIRRSVTTGLRVTGAELDKHNGPPPENYLLDKRDEEDEGTTSLPYSRTPALGGTRKSHLASEDSILSAMSAACVTSGCCCGLHA